MMPHFITLQTMVPSIKSNFHAKTHTNVITCSIILIQIQAIYLTDLCLQLQDIACIYGQMAVDTV
jgi:hypothetical protein